MDNDTPRQVATSDDKHTLTIEQVADIYSNAGHPRTIRTLQRYCKNRHLDSLLNPTLLGDMYLVTPESVSRHIAELNEISATTSVATDRGQPRLVATIDAEPLTHDGSRSTPETMDDTSRPTATNGDADVRYVARLESENEFLRGQINTKDGQIKELTERSRETNMLVAGLQKMLSPLLGAPNDKREHREVHEQQ
jgi:hypothetical protein